MDRRPRHPEELRGRQIILEEMDLREFAAIANVAGIPRLCEIIAIQPHCGSSRTLQVVFAEAPFESEEPVGTHRHVNSLNVAYASFTPASIASSVAASTLLASRGLPDTMRPFLLVSVLHRLPMGGNSYFSDPIA
jgi:hypothetical protein